MPSTPPGGSTWGEAVTGSIEGFSETFSAEVLPPSELWELVQQFAALGEMSDSTGEGSN